MRNNQKDNGSVENSRRCALARRGHGSRTGNRQGHAGTHLAQDRDDRQQRDGRQRVAEILSKQAALAMCGSLQALFTIRRVVDRMRHEQQLGNRQQQREERMTEDGRADRHGA